MRKLGTVFLTIAILLMNVSNAFANEAYAWGGDGGTSTGGFFQAYTRTLTATSTGYIAHCMWIGTDSNGSTISTGFHDGLVSGNYAHGFFRSRTVIDSNGNVTSFSKYLITGPSTSTGTNHTYQIKRTDSSTWTVYIDYTSRGSYSVSATQTYGMDVGLYTDNADNYSADWNEKSFQVYRNGSWYYWTSGYWLYDPWVEVEWDVEPTSIFTRTV